MTVKHIVSFRFKDDIPNEDREKVHTDFLQLASTCKRETGEKYIIDLVGGKKNVSTEGVGKDFDQTYIVTFADIADRDWYVNKDTTHESFAERVKKMVNDVFVYDFEHE